MESNIVSFIAIAISIVGAASPFIIAYVRSKRQKAADDTKIGSDAVNTTATALSISNDAMNQVKSIRDDMEKMCADYQEEIGNLKIEVQLLRDQLEQREIELLDLRDWAERLVYQVKSLGGTPVEMKKRGKGETTKKSKTPEIPKEEGNTPE